MKKIYIILLTVFMLAMSATAYAYHDENNDRRNKHNNNHYEQRNDHRPDRHYDWSHPRYHRDNWRHMEHYYGDLPFRWYDNRRNYRDMVIIDRQEWNDRFPGLVSYRWHADLGGGFWYQGRRIHDAVLFYDNEERLVSIGFRHNNAFIIIRDDNDSYRNQDAFFSSWSDQNFNIQVRN